MTIDPLFLIVVLVFIFVLGMIVGLDKGWRT